MKVTSPWFWGFSALTLALVTASAGWGLSLTPQFGLIAVTALFIVFAAWGLFLALDDWICETCDLSLGRYYGVLWGFLGSFSVGLVLAFILVIL